MRAVGGALNMNSITFEIDDVTIQLVHGDVLMWAGTPDGEPDIVIPIARLREALSTATMLVASDVTGQRSSLYAA